MLNNKIITYFILKLNKQKKCFDVSTSQHQFGTAAIGKKITLNYSMNHTERIQTKQTAIIKTSKYF